MSEGKKLWGGRFKDSADLRFAAFNNSFKFDVRLLEVDIEASRAYCEALFGASVITSEEAGKIREGLGTIIEKAQSDQAYLVNSDAEDVHSFVEARLVELIGDAGKKLHTGRSRNDQVATDFRLWVRNAIDSISEQLHDTQTVLLDFAEANRAIAIPGYTHLQRAQPVLLAHWCLAYFEMLARDAERLHEVRSRVNVLPLGSAALAGTSLNINREALARELGFDSVSKNSLDAVSDRDFVIEFLSSCSLVMMHLSRLAEDIILYCTHEFGFFELGDAVATGSSLMPQKKNPDSMELVRGKTGRVFGHLHAMLATMKGLPLAYNKDMQEDKEAVFDSFDTVHACLEISSTVLRNLSVNAERASAAASTGYMNATELADYLVRKGVPFREAHEVVGRVVMYALEQKKELGELKLEEFMKFSRLISSDVFECLTLERTLDAKSAQGGTAPNAVESALTDARRELLGRSK